MRIPVLQTRTSISITRCGSWRITTRRNLGESPRTVGPARPKPQTLTRSTRRKVTEASPLGSCHTRSPHPDSRGDVSSQHRSREQHRHLPVGCRLDWLVLEWTGECPSHDTPCSIPARCSPTFKIGPHHMRLILSQRSLLLTAACHTSHPYPTLPKVAKAFAEAWPSFWRTHQIEHCYCPDMVTGQLLSLLGFSITKMAEKWRDTFEGCALDSPKTQSVAKLEKVRQPTTSPPRHYASCDATRHTPHPATLRHFTPSHPIASHSTA